MLHFLKGNNKIGLAFKIDCKYFIFLFISKIKNYFTTKFYFLISTNLKIKNYIF